MNNLRINKINFIKTTRCPICKSVNLIKIGNIKHNIKQLNGIFDLLRCNWCSHRFLSKFPRDKLLKDLYKKDSPLVFGGTHEELKGKGEFINNKFKKIMPYKDHWIFRYIDKSKKGKYFEIGPGLCRLYKTFFENGWTCQGLELRSFIKGPGIKTKMEKINYQNDVVVAFDVLEHVVNPIKYLTSINKKMRKKGKIFLTFPHSESFKSRLLKDKWSMVVPLSHIHFFSKKSSEVMLMKSGFKILFIKEFSLVEPRRLIRNTLKLPFLILQDIFCLRIKNIFFRFFETFLNILDLLNGDQIKIVAYKIK